MNKLVVVGVAPCHVFHCRAVKRGKHYFQVPIYEGFRILEKAEASCDGLSKRFKYIMSHVTDKLEILGIMHAGIYFRYHEARTGKTWALCSSFMWMKR